MDFCAQSVLSRERGATVKAALAVLGTASDVGKSVVAAGLCRLLADAGVDVVPFKAQNMANQAGVTRDGLEMPRAQILQAQAARKEAHVDMKTGRCRVDAEVGLEQLDRLPSQRRPVDHARACSQK